MAKTPPLSGDSHKKKPAAPHSADQVWPLAKIKPYEKNARVLSAHAVDKCAASIKAFGWRQRIVVDKHGVILAGHTRWKAAMQLGLKEAPVHIAANLTPAECKGYRLADNRTAAENTWDLDLLGPELLELQALDLDLSLTGFDADELKMFMSPGTEGLTDPDDCPAAQAEAISVAGDLWLLGEHRLLAGDSTVATDVERLLGGTVPHLMVTDPPYGVEYDPKWRLDAGVNKPWQKRAEGTVSNDDNSDWSEAWLLFPGEVAYVWHAGRYASSVQSSLESAEFIVRSQIIWAKASLVMGRGHYHWQHEPCWYAVKKGATGHWAGDRKQSTLWQIANMHRTQGNVDDGKTNHSTQKPIECMLRPMQNNSRAGDSVYDPFCGSGTTLIAAEQSGRKCFAMELDARYVDMIIRRFQAFSGKQATLDGTGQTFAELEAERGTKTAAA